MAAKFIAGTVGSTPRQVAELWKREFDDVALGAPAIVLPQVAGRIGDRPWREAIRFEEVPVLTTLLHTAALFVVGYLSGMRPAEVLNLRRGCCRRVQDLSGREIYAIGGREFKRVREAGVSVPEGRLRAQPWYVVEQVAAAISVVEKLHDEPVLWPAKPPWSPGGGHTSGRNTMRSGTAVIRFSSFIASANNLARMHQRTHEMVPDDTRVTISALRRTLAWFIVWQPGGDLAAGLQYGHLEPLVTTQGYSGRSRSALGLGDVINMERLRRVVDVLADAADGLDRGERVSGPATDRYFNRVAKFRERFEGRLLNERQMSQLREMPDLRIYESPTQYLTCVMDPTKALCLAGGTSQQATPNLTRCNSRCANGVRTDTDAAAMRAEAARLRLAADSAGLPEPLRQRHRQRADHLEADARTHEVEAVGAPDHG